MKKKFIKGVAWVLGKKENSADIKLETIEVDNTGVQLKQLRALVAVLLIVGLIIGSVVLFIKQKTEGRVKPLMEEQVLTVELADKTLDPEKHWRNYFEERQEQVLKDVNKRLQDLSQQQEDMINKANQRIEEELSDTKEKLAIAQQELTSASTELQKVARKGEKQLVEAPHSLIELSEQEFDNEVELDRPKSVKNYIPEGTYFTGHLLGGMAVSTGLNTPNENATPVSIKLVGRVDAYSHLTTNLSPLNKIDLGNCRIMGSSYGDLSSERAVVRLEKMVCEQDGVYITSKIAGQIFGPDGLNGVKGTVVTTSSKLIKNAAIGGLISGISSAAKGQEGALISGTGLIQTQKKGAKNLLGEGSLQGVSNAGDKIADYYLRQAEAMSPILTVPSGVRVNAQITKGFFVGEVSTHKRIKADRSDNASVKTGDSKSTNSRISNNYSSSDIQEDIKSEYGQ
jgi:conjugal transfer pilus assembly protein TraB